MERDVTTSESTVEETPEPQENRKHKRYDCNMIVQIWRGDELLPATVTNLSHGGAFIEPQGGESFEYGEDLVLRIKLPMVEETAEIPVVVRWATPSGVGVQFKEIGPLHVWGLNKLISTLRESSR